MHKKLQQLILECTHDVSKFKAGTVTENTHFWAQICQDPSILRLVSGLKIPVFGPVLQTKLPREIQFSNDDERIVDREICAMLHQGVIEQVSCGRESGEFISNIFIRPKKDGGVRVILNLRKFNENVHKTHFKMHSLQSAIDLMKPNSYLASVDFKSAYFSVAIKPSHRKYLRFFYKGRKYQFAVLPNGLSTGPRDFTQIVKTLFRVLREKGHLNTWYLDDSLLAHQTFIGCLQNVLDTIELSREAGFFVHPVKSVLIPTQRLVFLGFTLCTVTMTVRLTAEKCIKIKSSIRSVLRRSSFSIQELSELIGQLVATFPGVPLGKLYYRQLDIEKSQALKLHFGDYSQKMSLSRRAISDLIWWLENIDNCFTKIERKNPTKVLKTDASNLGFGGCTDSNSISGQWDSQDQLLHINQKELLAVFYCLTKLCHDITNSTIKIMTDNTTTLCYVNNMGGKIVPCNEIARKIWLWAADRNIWLICSFIPGKLNVEADRLSRMVNETTEWSLEPRYFRAIANRFPGLDIDLFASYLNNKLPNYVSWMSDQKATYCDAFSLDWSQFYAYAFPPFSLIGRVLRKVQLDRANMVIVVPEWRSQYWFSILMSLLTEEPLFLPRNGRAICNPVNSQTAPVTSRFVVCSISGSRTTTPACRRQSKA